MGKDKEPSSSVSPELARHLHEVGSIVEAHPPDVGDQAHLSRFLDTLTPPQLAQLVLHNFVNFPVSWGQGRDRLMCLPKCSVSHVQGAVCDHLPSVVDSLL